jgi:drug/metabolite transporter (DMT)-like permease
MDSAHLPSATLETKPLKYSGLLLMCLAQVAFTIMLVFVKIAREELSTLEVAFWRSLVAIPILMVMYRKVTWNIHDRKTILLRIVFGFCALYCFFGAAKGLFIADLSLLSKIQPILVALLAPLLIGYSESASRKLWGLMILAMFGCTILLAPSLKIGSYYGLLAVLAAIFSAHAHVFIRRLRNEHSGIIVLWFQIGSGLLAFLVSVLTLETFNVPPSHLWLPLIGIGFMATFGQLLMTFAYKNTKAATVAIASYIGPLMAVCADVLAFGVFPTWNVYLGGSIVVLAGGLLLHKSRTGL